MQVFSFTDKGPRAQNQDSYCAERLDGGGLLVAVADGVGGNNGGQAASHYVIELLRAEVNNQGDLEDVLDKAHSGLLDVAAHSPDLHGMATTLTAVLYHRNAIAGVHCGDSRAYLLRRNGIKQLTSDHTEVAMLLAGGRISKEEALNYPRKNVLTSALGTQKNLIKQSFSFDIQRGDRLLLITDGVYSVLSKREIQRESQDTAQFDRLCERLIDKVKERDPTDNFTLVGVEFDDCTETAVS